MQYRGAFFYSDVWDMGRDLSLLPAVAIACRATEAARYVSATDAGDGHSPTLGAGHGLDLPMRHVRYQAVAFADIEPAGTGGLDHAGGAAGQADPRATSTSVEVRAIIPHVSLDTGHQRAICAGFELKSTITVLGSKNSVNRPLII